jgi:hypothetical protein
MAEREGLFAFVATTGVLVGSVDPRVYRLTAIQKAAYRIAASATVAIGSPSETAVPLTFQFPKPVTEAGAQEVGRALLDQDLRSGEPGQRNAQQHSSLGMHHSEAL